MLDPSSTSDFTSSSSAATTATLPRTLLLSPPSLSSHPTRLSSLLAAHDRTATDIQMLDRLALSLVSLPPATYDVILLLTDADATRTESKRLLDRAVLARLVEALRPGGVIRSQDGGFASGRGGNDAEAERREVILAGLVVEDGEQGGARKPQGEAAASVPLRLGRKAKSTTTSVGTGVEEVKPVAAQALGINENGKRSGGDSAGAANGNAMNAGSGKPALAGVGFDMGDDFSDDELIDEDDLIDEADLQGRIVQREWLPLAHLRHRWHWWCLS
jgi:hypothetical protein